MKTSKILIGAALIVLTLGSCQNDIFFFPFNLTPTLQTASIPEHFSWTTSSRIDLQIEFEVIGDTIEPIDGHFLYLLDSTGGVMARALVTGQKCHLFHKVDRGFGKMKAYLPLTGNYEEIYSHACLGSLLMEIAWPDPEEENDLLYLENVGLKDPEGAGSGLKGSAETLFGNNDFSDPTLGEANTYNNIRSADGQWYKTTKTKVPVSIEEYEGNPGIMMGQSSNGNDVEVGQVIEFSEEGNFIVGFDVISPSSAHIKLKAYLYFMDEKWKKLKQVSTTVNLNNPSGWYHVEIYGEVPSNNTYIQLVLQDYDNREPIFIDDVVTNFDSDPDADDDGVPDEEDNYPADAKKAFNNYFPAEESFSSLAFEDLWPYKGDYDFNDLVVDWQMNAITNAQNKVVSIEGKIVLKAIGGSFHNGFGLELPVGYQQIEEVKGINLEEGLVTLRANGTEAGATKTVIIVFEDAYNKMENPGFAYVNTRTSDAYIDPAEVNFEILFSTPVEIAALGLPPYNPFIFVNGNRGREVHLHGQAPTELADPSFLGSGDDYSDTIQGTRYYQTSSNLPFGMEISESFEYPVEKAPIDSAYTYFIEWAESGGRQKTDWHQNKQGYRRTEKIFKK